MKSCLIIVVFFAPFLQSPGQECFDKRIFEDRFERTESLQDKGEPNNDWTTSNDPTARQVLSPACGGSGIFTVKNEFLPKS